MSDKTIQPWVKTTLEMGPVILFFIFYSLFIHLFLLGLGLGLGLGSSV
jgi:hypothetical protein